MPVPLVLALAPLEWPSAGGADAREEVRKRGEKKPGNDGSQQQGCTIL